MSEFGAKLQEWREAAGLSRAELERSIDKGRNYVQRLEEGERTELPDRATCDAIAVAIGVDPSTVWASALVSLGREDIRQYYELRETMIRNDYRERLDRSRDLSSDDVRLLDAVQAISADAPGKVVRLIQVLHNVSAAHGAPNGPEAIAELIDHTLELDRSWEKTWPKDDTGLYHAYGVLISVLRGLLSERQWGRERALELERERAAQIEELLGPRRGE